MNTATKTTTVRVTRETQAKLRAISEESGASIQEIIDEAVEAYRRRRIHEQANESYAALRQNPERWQEYTDEFEAWDATLMDGLEEEG